MGYDRRYAVGRLQQVEIAQYTFCSFASFIHCGDHQIGAANPVATGEDLRVGDLDVCGWPLAMTRSAGMISSEPEMTTGVRRPRASGARPGLAYRGKTELPIKNSSTARAH